MGGAQSAAERRPPPRHLSPQPVQVEVSPAHRTARESAGGESAGPSWHPGPGAGARPRSAPPRHEAVAGALTGPDVAHTWPSGAAYRGGMQGGKLHGFGRYTGLGGEYEGEYEMDEQQGWGRQCLPGGGVYRGQYSRGHMHGVGDYEFETDKQGHYRGGWAGSDIEGFGVYVKPNGTRYVGEWKGNMRHGAGYIVRRKGQLEQTQYEGEWLWDREHGLGLLVTNAHQYFGNWMQGLRHGHGVLAEYGADGEAVEYIVESQNNTLLYRYQLGSPEAERLVANNPELERICHTSLVTLRKDRRLSTEPASHLLAREAEMNATYNTLLADYQRRNGHLLALFSEESGLDIEDLRLEREADELKKMLESYRKAVDDAKETLQQKDKEMMECTKSITWLDQQIHDQAKEQGAHLLPMETRMATEPQAPKRRPSENKRIAQKVIGLLTPPKADLVAPSATSPRRAGAAGSKIGWFSDGVPVAGKPVVPRRNVQRLWKTAKDMALSMKDVSAKAERTDQRIHELTKKISILDGSRKEIQDLGPAELEALRGTSLSEHIALRQQVDRNEALVRDLRASGQQADEQTREHERQLQSDKERLNEQLSSMQEELLREREAARRLKEQVDSAGKEQAAKSSEEQAAIQNELDANRREVAEKARALQRIEEELRAVKEMGAKAAQRTQDEFGAHLREANKRVEAERSEQQRLEADIAKQQAQLSERDARERRLQEQASALEVHRLQLEEDMTALNHQKESIEAAFKAERANARRMHNQIEDMKGKIRVYARTRPFSQLEKSLDYPYCLKFTDEYSISVTCKAPGAQNRLIEREYVFDRCFPGDSAQSEIFEDCENLIQSAVDGYNVCCFAYGQTGSGKTWTLTGTEEQPGVARSSMKELFDIKRRMESTHLVNVTCYMVELYNDKLIDLLIGCAGAGEVVMDSGGGGMGDSRRKSGAGKKGRRKSGAGADQKDVAPPPLQIKKDDHGMVCVIGVTEMEADTYEELYDIFCKGQDSRTVRTTRMNSASSRSHSVFAIKISSISLDSGAITTGKLSICDLAGSERLGKTELVDKQAVQEAKSINSSLTALGNVISALSKNERHIPYRDSKLTQLMSDSLGGNAKTLMFVNVSPSQYNSDETVSSLNYASRVKLITNDAKKAVESEEIKRLKAQISKLKRGEAVDEYRDIE